MRNKSRDWTVLNNCFMTNKSYRTNTILQVPPSNYFFITGDSICIVTLQSRSRMKITNVCTNRKSMYNFLWPNLYLASRKQEIELREGSWKPPHSRLIPQLKVILLNIAIKLALLIAERHWLIDWLIFIGHKTNVYAIVTIDKKTSTHRWYRKKTQKIKERLKHYRTKYNTRKKNRNMTDRRARHI